MTPPDLKVNVDIPVPPTEPNAPVLRAEGPDVDRIGIRAIHIGSELVFRDGAPLPLVQVNAGPGKFLAALLGGNLWDRWYAKNTGSPMRVTFTLAWLGSGGAWPPEYVAAPARAVAHLQGTTAEGEALTFQV